MDTALGGDCQGLHERALHGRGLDSLHASAWQNWEEGEGNHADGISAPCLDYPDIGFRRSSRDHFILFTRTDTSERRLY